MEMFPLGSLYPYNVIVMVLLAVTVYAVGGGIVFALVNEYSYWPDDFKLFFAACWPASIPILVAFVVCSVVQLPFLLASHVADGTKRFLRKRDEEPKPAPLPHAETRPREQED